MKNSCIVWQSQPRFSLPRTLETPEERFPREQPAEGPAGDWRWPQQGLQRSLAEASAATQSGASVSFGHLGFPRQFTHEIPARASWGPSVAKCAFPCPPPTSPRFKAPTEQVLWVSALGIWARWVMWVYSHLLRKD